MGCDRSTGNIRSHCLRLLFTLLAATAVSANGAANDPLVQLVTGDEAFQGRLFARNPSTAWLLGRAGELNEVPLSKVTSFAVVDREFRPLSVVEMRAAMQRQVAGSGMTVVASPHYVVCGSANTARRTVEAMESVYGDLRWFAQTRRLPITEPEFPMVAVVCTNREAFDRECRSEGVSPHPFLKGYYRPSTNRFLLYEDPADAASYTDMRDTVVHEAVHQFGFNCGLHSRIGSNSKWVVEGLAMTLEPSGARRAALSGRSPMDRVNRERLSHYLSLTAQPNTLRFEHLIGTDAAFGVAPLDAYALAWAATFYLTETRPADYGRYLNKLAARPALEEPSRADRIAEFKAAFGGDLAMFEANLERYYRRLVAQR